MDGNADDGKTMQAARLIGGAALALGTGVAAGVIAHNLMYERTNVSPEVKRSRSTGNSQGDGYRAVFLPVIGAMGGVGALVGAQAQLKAGPLGAVLGLAALGGAGLGMTVGYAMGAAKGSSEADATYGATHEQRTDEQFQRLDIDRSGALDLAPDGRLPEFLTTGGHSYERLLRAADTNADSTVTRAEYIALLDSLDTDRSGKLSTGEAFEAATKYGSYV